MDEDFIVINDVFVELSELYSSHKHSDEENSEHTQVYYVDTTLEPLYFTEAIKEMLKEHGEFEYKKLSKLKFNYKLLSLPQNYKVKRRKKIDWGDEELSNELLTGGLLTFSRVYFDVTHTKAMLYLNHLVGPLSGSGDLVVLIKKDKWNYLATIPILDI